MSIPTDGVLSKNSSGAQYSLSYILWYSLPASIPLCWEAMRMQNGAGGGLDWVGLPVIATVARLLSRELTLQNENRG